MKISSDSLAIIERLAHRLKTDNPYIESVESDGSLTMNIDILITVRGEENPKDEYGEPTDTFVVLWGRVGVYPEVKER